MSKHVEIKTHYKNKNDCIMSCLDHHGKTYLAWFFNKDISGVVDEKGNFELSSRSGAAALQVFCGKILEREDGIYMVGEIKPKPFIKKLLLLFSAILILTAPVYIIEWKIWGIVYELIFFAIIFINYRMMYRFDMLFRRIYKKVS